MKSDDRRMNDDGRRTVRRQNDDDRRTVRRQKGERNSDGKRTNGGDRRTVRRRKGERNGGDRRTNDDDKRTETRRRGVIRKFARSQQIINTRLNAFSGRIDGVEQQIDQVGQKVNRIEKEFQENRGRNRKKTRKKIRGHQTAGTKRNTGKDRRARAPITSYFNSRFRRLFDLTSYSVTTFKPYAYGKSIPDEQQNDYDMIVGALEIRLDRIHRFASEKLKMHSDKMKQRLDTTSTETAFEPGDAVWLYAPKRMKGRSPKLQKNWEGPYTIIKKINDLVYRIQLSPRSKPKVVHLERLARYTGHDPPDWIVVEDPPPRTEDSVIRDE
ncbi:hypothetical protein NQ318_002632 [Aromia moschata]|uniref:Integrase p58-like C-terminal domain-containing protein n=1 Tax=Aromia moschata TaxID=1265417 RepID=A0AAV8YB85_9CUCU|nr:hypothetical protein NQ318_002632 [Aromia moschata]